jgi:hypothetical protein
MYKVPELILSGKAEKKSFEKIKDDLESINFQKVLKALPVLGELYNWL